LIRDRLLILFPSLSIRFRERSANLQIDCFGNNYAGLARSKVSFRLGPCARTYVYVHSICLPMHYDIRSLANSVSPFVAASALSWAGGSESHESAADSFTNRSRSIWIAVDRSSPRSIGHAHGLKDSVRLDHIRSGSCSNVGIVQVSHCISDGDTNSFLHRCWEDEEIHQPLPLTENKRCEQHVVSAHSRMPDGIYIVRLPFKTGSLADLGDSLPIATVLYARKESRLRSR